MDAVEYLKQKNRMTNNCTIACNICPLAIENNNGNLVCANRDTISLEEAVATVENWAKEHPVRTYMSVFLEKFPDAEKEDGVPAACVVAVFGEKKKPEGCYNSINCSDCWNREVEE